MNLWTNGNVFHLSAPLGSVSCKITLSADGLYIGGIANTLGGVVKILAEKEVSFFTAPRAHARV